MKNLIILSLFCLSLTAYAESAEVCGKVKSISFNGIYPAVVNFQDGRVIKAYSGERSVAVILSSIASDLTVCFKAQGAQDQGGPYYLVVSVSK